MQHELHLLAYFYPRPPRGGRREPESRFCCCRKFLSTPSARRATRDLLHQRRTDPYFYPRPPRGGRQKPLDYGILGVTFLSTPSARRATRGAAARTGGSAISIHALREEGDNTVSVKPSGRTYFYPRPPRGGRLFKPFFHPPKCRISIHALREEGDAPPSKNGQTGGYFYPRPPRGGRPHSPQNRRRQCLFLSTPSARRAT